MAHSSQYSVPVASVQKLLLKHGIIELTQRKRLVFIQRVFERGGEQGQCIYTAKLDAGYWSLQEQCQKWLPWMTSYDSEERYENLSQEFKKCTGKDPEFRKFSVILSSILFITRFDADDFASVKSYFKHSHHRQAGVHVFVRHYGHLFIMVNNIVSNPELGKYNKKEHYSGDLLAPVHSIYPVIRHEWQTTGKDNVVYGLNFGQPSNAQTVADISGRYYHRFSDYCLKAYGVNELTKEDILNFKRRIGGKPFTAFYLCAGAKLIVTDLYSTELIKGIDSDNNRSLVQQGGVVIFEGLVNIKVHIKYFKERNVTVFETHDWPQFSHQFIKPLSQNSLDYENLKQMVIFLGGIDSDRNSIAWDLKIEDINGSKVAYLGIPIDRNRNTPIEAISEGSSGLDEIIARMGYEQLHDSVLTEHRTDFIPVQDHEILQNILNINGERCLDVDFRRTLKPNDLDGFIDKDLPLEFNLSNPSSAFLKLADNDFFKKQLERKTRAAPPPMYPPILANSKIIYWPSSGVPIVDVQTECYKYDRTKKLSIVIKHHGSLEAQKNQYHLIQEVQAFHYERMTGEGDQQFWNYSGLYHVSNTSFYRIGVDGWMWRKVRSDPINGKSSPIYYEKNVYLKPY